MIEEEEEIDEIEIARRTRTLEERFKRLNILGGTGVDVEGDVYRGYAINTSKLGVIAAIVTPPSLRFRITFSGVSLSCGCVDFTQVTGSINGSYFMNEPALGTTTALPSDFSNGLPGVTYFGFATADCSGGAIVTVVGWRIEVQRSIADTWKVSAIATGDSILYTNVATAGPIPILNIPNALTSCGTGVFGFGMGTGGFCSIEEVP